MTEIEMNKLPLKTKAEVFSVNLNGAIKQRLNDLGLIEGTVVEKVMKSPMGGMDAYLIKGAVIAVRDNDAKEIKVNILC